VEVLRELGDVAEPLPGLTGARDQRLARHRVAHDPLLERRELAALLLLAVLEANHPLALDRRRAFLAEHRLGAIPRRRAPAIVSAGPRERAADRRRADVRR